MNKQELEILIEKCFSQREIAEELKTSQTTVRYWLKKFDLKTIRKLNDICCQFCKETDESKFYKNGTRLRKLVCRICYNKQCVDRFRSIKSKAIEYKGGKCIRCGYDKCPAALDFHHRDPLLKDPNWSFSKNRSLDKIKDELDKCDLVCKTCHAEIHWEWNNNSQV